MTGSLKYSNHFSCDTPSSAFWNVCYKRANLSDKFITCNVIVSGVFKLNEDQDFSCISPIKRPQDELADGRTQVVPALLLSRWKNYVYLLVYGSNGFL